MENYSFSLHAAQHWTRRKLGELVATDTVLLFLIALFAVASCAILYSASAAPR